MWSVCTSATSLSEAFAEAARPLSAWSSSYVAQALLWVPEGQFMRESCAETAFTRHFRPSRAELFIAGLRSDPSKVHLT
jgi:hypothetical protein